MLKIKEFFYKTCIVRKFSQLMVERHYEKFSPEELMYERFLLANEIFLESKRILSKDYPNIKFVILKYSDVFKKYMPEHPDLWKTLKDEGFIVIDTKDLIGREFTQEDTVEDNFHPNEHVWDLIVPKLVEKLGL